MKRNKVIRFLAMAALTGALLGSQIQPTLAVGTDYTVAVEKKQILDKIVVEEADALENMELPKSEYGTLAWKDPLYVPAESGEACEVVLTPGKNQDLSWMTGWDAKTKTVVAYIEVWIGELPEEEDTSGEEGEASYKNAEGESKSVASAEDLIDGENSGAENESSTANGESAGSGQNAENSMETEDSSMDENLNQAGSGDDSRDQLTADEMQASDGTVDQEIPSKENMSSGDREGSNGQDTSFGTATDSLDSEEISEDTTEAPGQEGTAGEYIEAPGQEETAGNIEETPGQEETNEDSTEAPDQEGTAGDTTEAPDLETPSGEDASGSDQEVEAPDQMEGTIFAPSEDFTDDRPVTANPDLSEEEQQLWAKENHTCQGITVVGENLPWYVQFRVTSGEAYTFWNQSSAEIFKSYEFELWDLMADQEYEIPDGEYVTVSMQVPEGYSYTIEHLLDSGARESITPSVEGTLLVFSTHSFSPFGIAGSTTLVGQEGIEQNYTTPTPTPKVTHAVTEAPKPTATQTPSASKGTSQGNTQVSSQTGSNGNTGSTKGSDDGTSSISTPAPAQSSSNAGNARESAVNTGDSTPILFYAGLAVIALLLIAVLILYFKKKKS